MCVRTCGLLAAKSQLEITIPETLPANAKEDDAFLQQLWSVIQDVHVIEGEMECPACHRKFPITQGIPNMVRCKIPLASDLYFSLCADPLLFSLQKLLNESEV